MVLHRMIRLVRPASKSSNHKNVKGGKEESALNLRAKLKVSHTAKLNAKEGYRVFPELFY